MSRILITDDSSSTRNLLKKYLLPKGFEILEAANGLEALELIEKYPPDCLLLDILMPGMDGFDVLKKLKASRVGFPVIMLTSDIQETTRNFCFKLGAKAFLNKPITEEKLCRIIDRFTNQGIHHASDSSSN